MKTSLMVWRKKDTVRNFRNSISENKPLFEILGNILKLYLAIIFGVRIFRVFEVLGKLPYYMFVIKMHFISFLKEIELKIN